MSLLQIMPEDSAATVLLRTEDPEKIGAELASAGASFERWRLAPPGDTDVLAAYREQIGQLQRLGGYQLVDVAAIAPDPGDPQWPAKAAAARGKFLAEHTHDEDEVRFFAAGRGCFYLHVDHRVLALVGEAGDLLSIPAGTSHWFDMGLAPRFTAIRFFQREDGWIGDFTGTGIASAFPSLDELIAQ
jgi:1,2-dihydroxy-3-keto-5-methylthiopentene dioxygenase